MRYYLIAGEASGDLHGANLMRGILKCDPQAAFRFWGGDGMAAVGGDANLARHYKTASFFGVTEVIANARTIMAQMRECKADIAAYKPDALILIDYPGFNLRMAAYARKLGIRVLYYIAPKVWAWKESRVKLLRRYVDRLYIIFPFETDYFASKGINAVFEGNPLVDVVEQRRNGMPRRNEFLAAHGIDPDRPVIALLAGSRRSEIRYNLPLMVEIARSLPDRQFAVAGVPWLERRLYDKYLAGTDIKFLCDCTEELLHHSEAAVVTSGTATLEAALIGIPEVVLYRTDPLQAYGRHLVLRIPYVSLVNLILGRECVKELIQSNMDCTEAVRELRSLLCDGSKRMRMLSDFTELRGILGGPGASDRFAADMVEYIKDQNA